MSLYSQKSKRLMSATSRYSRLQSIQKLLPANGNLTTKDTDLIENSEEIGFFTKINEFLNEK